MIWATSYNTEADVVVTLYRKSCMQDNQIPLSKEEAGLPKEKTPFLVLKLGKLAVRMLCLIQGSF